MVWFGVFWLGLAPSLLESLVLGLDSGEPVPQRTHFSLQHTISMLSGSYLDVVTP